MCTQRKIVEFFSVVLDMCLSDTSITILAVKNFNEGNGMFSVVLSSLDSIAKEQCKTIVFDDVEGVLCDILKSKGYSPIQKELKTNYEKSF